ncbi:MAG: response regulator transcription factor [Pseudomonadota bacterium]
MENKKVLVIEDDPDIGNLLMLHLNDLQTQAELCADGLRGIERLLSDHWDLVILDLRLPGLNGLDLCRRARAEGNRVPILMLTAKTSELDRVLGLEVGADDYVTKPFSVIEVMARGRALLRRVDMERSRQGEHLDVLCGAIRINEANRQVHMGEMSLDLTPREFDLLIHFARAPGQVFRRAQLLDHVWGFGHEGYEHTVNSHINRLRSKLQLADPKQEYIVTVWGVGYKLNDQLDVKNVA